MKRLPLLIIISLLLTFCACRRNPGDGVTDAPTDAATQSIEITTENREKTGGRRSVDAVTLTDTGLDITLTVPMPGAKIAEIDAGAAFVYTERSLDEIKNAVDAIEAEGEIKTYPYDGALRVEYLAVSGDLVTYSIVETVDAKGEKAYIFCDSRAFFSDGADYYATVKFPYFYLLDTDAFTPAGYVRLGDSFRIAVTPEEIRKFYADSGIYAVKESGGSEFSLEFPYFDADAKGYPLRFTFSHDSEGYRIVTVTTGTVEQVTDKF